MLPAGVESIDVYPDVANDDSYGTPERVPASTAIRVTGCWIFPVDADESRALGQGVNTVYAIVADEFPGGAWAKVTWNGREWDVVGEPRKFTSGFTGTALDMVHIRAREPAPL